MGCRLWVGARHEPTIVPQRFTHGNEHALRRRLLTSDSNPEMLNRFTKGRGFLTPRANMHGVIWRRPSCARVLAGTSIKKFAFRRSARRDHQAKELPCPKIISIERNCCFSIDNSGRREIVM
jgi:hypothetical protein